MIGMMPCLQALAIAGAIGAAVGFLMVEAIGRLTLRQGGGL